MPRMKLQKVTPLAYAPMVALETYARTHNDARTYELIKIRASELNGCGYCLAMHTRDARKQGESDERIAALAGDWRAVDLWSPAEAAALALTDEVTRLGEGGVSDATWDEAVARWGEKGVAGLIMAIVVINAWNRIAIPTGLEAADL
ncbi:carboxymuconolactone decarboxylase family protein [Naumannella cuiyingiana]|uniref:AhpD family alkylhydroperoxidase n=1 Tax=Naumannella cuiyingiana TaxID=1347891 RepID=A0A7Z0IJL0_9ACTN|nr:carboxymuconolactone decarboxylase family protein [Naumannella cuiyingiana]NYI69633.1 AhpD family alkylhydroperoxidase [Naumannella cuiyingiana]